MQAGGSCPYNKRHYYSLPPECSIRASVPSGRSDISKVSQRTLRWPMNSCFGTSTTSTTTSRTMTTVDLCSSRTLSLSLSLSFHYFCLFVVFMLFSLLCCDHHPSNLKPSTLSSKPAFSLRDRKTSQGIEHDLVSITRSRSQLDALGSLTVRLPRSRPSGWRVAAGCRSYASAAPACQSDERYMLHLTRHFTCYFFLTQNDCISITLPAFVANTFFRACNEQQYHI